MIRFLLRSLGLWFLAGGFAAAVVDGMKSIAASRPIATSAAAALDGAAPGLTATLAHWIADHLGAAVWPTLTATLLALPTWALAGGLGVVLVALGRPRPPGIGVVP